MCLVQLLCLQLVPNTVRAASSVGSEKDKLRASATGFVRQKTEPAKGPFLDLFSAGKDIW